MIAHPDNDVGFFPGFVLRRFGFALGLAFGRPFAGFPGPSFGTIGRCFLRLGRILFLLGFLLGGRRRRFFGAAGRLFARRLGFSPRRRGTPPATAAATLIRFF